MITPSDSPMTKPLHRFGNLILIGMPGSGKSALGKELAQQLGWPLLDTDRVIELRQRSPLQRLIDEQGLDAFLLQEQEALLSLDLAQTVIATGGSVIYSERGMANLQRLGLLVWLDVPLSELKRRIDNMDQRGLVTRDGQTFDDLYRQRLPLYRRWAGYRFAEFHPTPALTANALLHQLSALAAETSVSSD